MDETKHQYSVEEIRELVGCDRAWACRAIVALYKCQTPDEQASMETKHHNSAGFNGVDAEILSSFAEQLLRPRRLSDKQMQVAYRKLPKYAAQLHRIAYGK